MKHDKNIDNLFRDRLVNREMKVNNPDALFLKSDQSGQFSFASKKRTGNLIKRIIISKVACLVAVFAFAGAASFFVIKNNYTSKHKSEVSHITTPPANAPVAPPIDSTDHISPEVTTEESIQEELPRKVETVQEENDSLLVNTPKEDKCQQHEIKVNSQHETDCDAEADKKAHEKKEIPYTKKENNKPPQIEFCIDDEIIPTKIFPDTLTIKKDSLILPPSENSDSIIEKTKERRIKKQRRIKKLR